MAKSPYSPQWRAMVAQEYLNGERSLKEIGKKHNVNDVTVFRWSLRFQDWFGTKTPMEVHIAALNTDCPESYPIAENKRVKKFKSKFAA